MKEYLDCQIYFQQERETNPTKHKEDQNKKQLKKKRAKLSNIEVDSKLQLTEENFNFSWTEARLKDVWPNVIFKKFISSLDDLKSIRLVCSQFRNFIDSLPNIYFQFKITSLDSIAPIIYSYFKQQFPKISSFYFSGNEISHSSCSELISRIPDYSTNITIEYLFNGKDLGICEDCGGIHDLPSSVLITNALTTKSLRSVKNMNNLSSLSLNYCSIQFDVFTILPSSLTHLKLDHIYVPNQQQQKEWSFSTPNLKYLKFIGFDCDNNELTTDLMPDLSQLKELPSSLLTLTIDYVRIDSKVICSATGLTSLTILDVEWSDKTEIIDLSNFTNLTSLQTHDGIVHFPTSIQKLNIFF